MRLKTGTVAPCGHCLQVRLWAQGLARKAHLAADKPFLRVVLADGRWLNIEWTGRAVSHVSDPSLHYLIGSQVYPSRRGVLDLHTADPVPGLGSVVDIIGLDSPAQGASAHA